MKRFHPARATLLLALLGTPVAAQGDWSLRAPMPTPRQELSGAALDGRVYTLGGQDWSFFATDTVEIYDVATDTWSSAAPMPVGLDHTGVVTIGDRIWVVGGFGADFKAKDVCMSYDPEVDTWQVHSPMPDPRAAAGVAEWNGTIIVCGGKDLAYVETTTTFLYDTATDTWSEGAPMPTAREHLTAARVGDHVYAVGGRALGASQGTTANERYHPASDTWTTMAPMPTPRSAPGTAAFGSRIYVAGGEVPTLQSAVEVYDVATDTWLVAKDMPVPRHGLPALPLEGGLLFPGGGTVQGFAPTDHTDFLRPEALLTATAPSISLSAGGSVALDVEMEAAAAGDLYWVLGSFSGTAPEQPVGLLGLPLVFDPYFVLTATTPNTGPLGSTLGVLGASGDAQATLTLPPGSPAILGGSTVHHAFGVFDAGSLMVEFISNPVPTRLLP